MPGGAPLAQRVPSALSCPNEAIPQYMPKGLKAPEGAKGSETHITVCFRPFGGTEMRLWAPLTFMSIYYVHLCYVFRPFGERSKTQYITSRNILPQRGPRGGQYIADPPFSLRPATLPKGDEETPKGPRCLWGRRALWLSPLLSCVARRLSPLRGDL